MDINANNTDKNANTNISEQQDIKPVEEHIKVSVIMPIYNADEYLVSTLESVLAQTLREIEVICIDDGSTDGSLEILKQYQKKDERIRIVTQANAGPGHARNNGIRRARGEYVAFLDADDFYEAEMLESLYNKGVQQDLEIVISDYDIYNERKGEYERAIAVDHAEIFKDAEVISKNEYPNRIFFSTNCSAWNKIFKTEFIVSKNIAFPVDNRVFEDVYFIVITLSLAERVGMVNKVLMHHRVHHDQTRTRLFKKYYDKVPQVYLDIKTTLMSVGMYAPLSFAFLNFSASRCYKIYNLLPSDEKAKFWNILNAGYAEKLGWQARKNEDFEDSDVHEFVANVVLYDHKKYKKRCAKGKSLPTKNMDKVVIKKKKRQKIREFFLKPFKKKDKDEDKTAKNA